MMWRVLGCHLDHFDSRIPPGCLTRFDFEYDFPTVVVLDIPVHPKTAPARLLVQDPILCGQVLLVTTAPRAAEA